MTDAEALVSNAMIKVRKEVQQRRLRLEPFFHDFDKFKCGRVTKDQFARVLSTARVLSLTPAELAAVTDHFDTQNNNNNNKNSSASRTSNMAGSVFNYIQFLQAVHQTPTNNAATTATARALAGAAGGAPPSLSAFQDPCRSVPAHTKQLSPKDKDLMDSAMAVFRRQVRIQNISLLPPFYDFDPLHTGRVTRSQFARCLPFKTVDGRVLQVLMDYFGDATGENVCYLAWCQAVDDTLLPTATTTAADKDDDAANPTRSAPSPHANSTAMTTTGRGARRSSVSSSFFSGTTRNKDLTAEELVRLLRAQCGQYKIRCEDYFADADKFHTGLVNAAQFESVLGRLQLVGFALSAENVDALVRCYALEDHLRSTADAPQNNNNNNNNNTLQNAKNTTLYNSLTQANKHLARVNYKSFLYDINPKNFPEEASDNSRESSGRRTSVNYFATRHLPDAFLDSIKPNNNNNNNNNNNPAGVLTATTKDGKTEKEAADAILGRIRRLVTTNRIFLSPIFRDFDHVTKSIKEHRTCTATRFARGLATQNLVLPERELELLTRKYTVPRADGSPSEEVNYYQFVRDVEQANTNTNTNTTTTTSHTGTAIQRLQQAADDTAWRPATSLEELLEKMVREAHERHLRLSAFFLDFDPLRSGQVQQDKFISALSLCGLQLREAEIALLQEAYRSKRVPLFVDLVAFLKDLNSYTVEDSADTAFFHSQRWAATGTSADERKMVSTLKQSVGEAAAAAAAQFSPAEQQTLQQVLNRLRHNARSHNALLTPFFEDFDRFHRGTISRGHFQQALARHQFVLSEAERRLLERFYAAPTDPQRVAYRRFVADVGFEETAPAAAPATAQLLAATADAHKSQSKKAPSEEETAALVEDVLQKVCCFLQERHACIDEFFRDGDELRHQHISAGRFRSGLSALGDAAALHLQEAELAALERSFACAQDPSQVNYPLFAQHIRAKLDAGEGLAAVHARRAGSTRAPTTASVRTLAATQPIAAEGAGQTQEERVFIATMLKVRRLLASRRTNALPAFREYDPTRKGRVKESQFFSCLLSLGVRLTPQESAAVAAAYSLDNGEVGYVRFVEEVDETNFASSS